MFEAISSCRWLQLGCNTAKWQCVSIYIIAAIAPIPVFHMYIIHWIGWKPYLTCLKLNNSHNVVINRSLNTACKTRGLGLCRWFLWLSRLEFLEEIHFGECSEIFQSFRRKVQSWLNNLQWWRKDSYSIQFCGKMGFVDKQNTTTRRIWKKSWPSTSTCHRWPLYTQAWSKDRCQKGTRVSCDTFLSLRGKKIYMQESC